MGWSSDKMILAYFCVVLLCGSALSSAPSAPRLRRAAPAERWLEIISQYAKERIDAERVGRPDYMPKPFPISLPIGAKEGGSAENLPILILPVPVHVASEGCTNNFNSQIQSVVAHNEATLNKQFLEATPTPSYTQPRPFGFQNSQAGQYQVSSNQQSGNQQIGHQQSGYEQIGNQQTGQQYQVSSNQQSGHQQTGNQQIGHQQTGHQQIGNQQTGQQQTGQQYQVSSKFEYNQVQENNVKTEEGGSLDQLVQKFNEEDNTEKPFVNKPIPTFPSKPFQFGSVASKTEFQKPIQVNVDELNVPQKPVFEFRPFSLGTKTPVVQSQYQFNQISKQPAQNQYQIKQETKKESVQNQFQFKPQQPVTIQSQFQFNQVPQKTVPIPSQFQFNPVPQKTVPIQSQFNFNQVQQKAEPVKNLVFDRRITETKPLLPKPVQIEPLKQFEFREPKPIEQKPAVQQPFPTQEIKYTPQLINSFIQNFPTPSLDEAVSSEYLLEQFWKQKPQAPHLPPAVIDDREVFPADEEPPYPAAQDGIEYQHQGHAGQPSKPRWPRSLFVRAFLTVPRADYTESYDMWYDGETGASRVEFHGGATVAYKTPLPGGLFQRIEMRIDNSGDAPVRRCNVAAPQPLAPVEVQAPGLPDLEQFEFAGFVKEKGQDSEKWVSVVKTPPGIGGGANGEALTYTHTVLLTRSGDYAKPLEYSVIVDSSVLGRGCDSYTHTYTEVVEKQHKPDIFTLNADSDCTEKWAADPAHLDQLATLEPLREFTLPTRDPRYDDAFVWFKKTFERDYIDDKEEAIRKNLLVQSTRFCNSGNREGATFELGVNFLGDRLDSELDVLLGVKVEEENIPAEDFPHSKSEIEKDDKALPDGFDWRDQGAVTPARYQGSCSSCWAFAVTAAVEGALFIKTGSLVPLAEQHLVDCGHTHGTHGCQGTWPSFAYDYIQDKGLPSLAEYGAHKEKVETCRQVTPVTHISAHVNVTKNSVPALKVAIRKHAPTVVIIDAKAKSFIYYKKGVLQDKRCGQSRMPLNHAVTAVGWGTKEGKAHFIIKNSWSAAWGENGFARLEGPTNTCGVLSLPSYPRLEKENVDRLPGGASSKA